MDPKILFCFFTFWELSEPFNTLFSPSLLRPCKCLEHLLQFIRKIVRISSFEFLIGIIPKLEAYSEPCQISKIMRFGKIITAESRQLYLQNAPSQMFDRVLNIPLHFSNASLTDPKCRRVKLNCFFSFCWTIISFYFLYHIFIFSYNEVLLIIAQKS